MWSGQQTVFNSHGVSDIFDLGALKPDHSVPGIHAGRVDPSPGRTDAARSALAAVDSTAEDAADALLVPSR